MRFLSYLKVLFLQGFSNLFRLLSQLQTLGGEISTKGQNVNGKSRFNYPFGGFYPKLLSSYHFFHLFAV